MLLAIPIAASPATPHPIIKTLAGYIFPAAVIYWLENLGKLQNASRTALYPERFVVELNVSNF